MKILKVWLSRPMLVGRKDPTTVLDATSFGGCQIHVDGALVFFVTAAQVLAVPLAQVDHLEVAPVVKGKK